jgi:chromosome segregation ATPase
MSKTADSPLVAAARALTEHLTRFEEASLDAARAPINSEKALTRARKTLQECSEHEGKLAASLRDLAAAMQGMQQQQQRCVEHTAVAAERIRQRQDERLALQERLLRLGDNARAVSAPVAALPDGASEPGSTEAIAPLQEVVRRLEAVIAEAAEVTALARQGDWADLERDTHSLEQQLQSARNRVLIGLRKLAEDAPS